MANQRDKRRVSVGFYPFPEERDALKRLATTRGYPNFSAFLTALARAEIERHKEEERIRAETRAEFEPFNTALKVAEEPAEFNARSKTSKPKRN